MNERKKNVVERSMKVMSDGMPLKLDSDVDVQMHSAHMSVDMHLPNLLVFSKGQETHKEQCENNHRSIYIYIYIYICIFGH